MASDYVDVLNQNTKNILPENAHTYLFDMILGVVSQNREGLLSVGFILATIFASSGMVTLMNGFDKSVKYSHAFYKRNVFKTRAVAVYLVGLLAALLIVSLLLIVFGEDLLAYIIDFLNVDQFSGLVFKIFRWLLVFSIFYSGYSIIYNLGPSLRSKISFFSPGSMLATILSIMSSLIFAWFVDNFGRYNEIYGSIGALIVLMIWLQINAFIIIVGFELNASIAVQRDNLTP